MLPTFIKSLMNLAEHIGGGDDLNTPTCPLSLYFEGIVGALLQFTDRQNNEANCRTSAYEALSTLVGNAAMVSDRLNQCVNI